MFLSCTQKGARKKTRPPAKLGSVARVRDRLIKAAGGVLMRDGKVALVHRPRYDDWTLPKGKLDPPESFEQAAVREVQEETGLRGRLVRELPPITYRVGTRPKIVRYWLMDVEHDGPFTPNDETDELRWVPVEEAMRLLTYDRDREVLRALSDDVTTER
jgi:8-oxo-dGTP pyrophosphatase MutT (NUDIX family)